MAAESNIKPLVVIVGPTASGKSSLAIELARKYNGELICADSRTIYMGMDIGTAKPSPVERSEIPHHILDVVSPDQSYSAAKFKQAALTWIDDISIRGKLPIMVGGTGLYIDSVIFDYAFLPPGSMDDRDHLQSLSVEELQQELKTRGIALPENSKNPRHLIRAIETNGAVAVKAGLRADTIVIGIDREKEEIISSIRNRIKDMMKAGLAAEVASLASRYGWSSPGLQAVGYQEWQDNKSQQEVERTIEANTVRYAKRQRTWFKRNPHIHWVKNVAEAESIIQNFLQK